MVFHTSRCIHGTRAPANRLTTTTSADPVLVPPHATTEGDQGPGRRPTRRWGGQSPLVPQQVDLGETDVTGRVIANAGGPGPGRQRTSCSAPRPTVPNADGPGRRGPGRRRTSCGEPRPTVPNAPEGSDKSITAFYLEVPQNYLCFKNQIFNISFMTESQAYI